MTVMLRVPRSRGVASGLLLVLLGAWGALVPFIGPYFHFAYTPDTAWAWTSGRLFLEVLPGVAAVLGGLILLVSAFRPAAMVGACLAAAAGAWFATGALFAPLATTNSTLGSRTAALDPGTAVGGPVHIVAEHLAFFTGLGLVIVFIAGLAFGRMAVIGARDAELVGRDAVVEEPVPVETVPARTTSTARTTTERTTTGSTDTADGDLPQRTSVFRKLTTARSSSSSDDG
jgi:hypothetical protein